MTSVHLFPSIVSGKRELVKCNASKHHLIFSPPLILTLRLNRFCQVSVKQHSLIHSTHLIFFSPPLILTLHIKRFYQVTGNGRQHSLIIHSLIHLPLCYLFQCKREFTKNKYFRVLNFK